MISTNLYTEDLAPQRTHRKVSRIAAVPIALFSVALLYYLVLQHSVAGQRRELVRLEVQRESLGETLTATKAKVAELNVRKQQREEVLRLATTRRSWAPVFQRALETVPANVQLNEMRLRCDWGKEAVLSIKGIAAGVEPYLEADRFRLMLNESFANAFTGAKAELKSVAPAEKKIRLNRETYQTASFDIDLHVPARLL